MPALKHIKGPRVTVGEMSKRPPEERGGQSKARASGAGRPRKDGTPPGQVPMEMRHLRNRHGSLPAAILRGPPSDAEIEAFEARWGAAPEDRLHPREVWGQLTLPMLPFDMELAKEICDRLAEGQTIPWMVRNWPGFPGTRNWRSWIRQPEVQEYRDVCLEARAEATILAGQDALAKANRDVEKVDANRAVAFVSAAKNLADVGIKAAQALAPKRFGQQLNVRAESTIEHKHSVETKLLEELKQQLGIGTMKVIEGEVL